MITPEDVGAVVHLDLRTGAAELGTARALRAAVAGQLGQAGLPEPDHPLFLVVDTPAGLTGHQRQYELLTAYRALGEIRILVLLVGSAPGSSADEDEAFPPDRQLVRPAVLRASGTGLLWAGDLRSARTALEQPAPDDPEALAVLVDVLSVPDLFLRVLDDVGSLPDAVAAPGVRLLEQDLPPEVRDRAWRDALTRFAGEDTEPAPGLPVTAWSTAELPEPLRGLVAGRGGHDQRHREPGGVADSAYRACADALDDAEDALTGLRAFPGLLSGSRRDAFEADLDQARQALGDYRDLVGTALHSGGSSTTPSAAEAATRLAALGLRVPSAEGVGERIGEGLREFAGKLLGRGLALRAVAQRFTGLAGRVEPVPGSALLPKLAGLSDARTGPRGGTPSPTRRPSRPGRGVAHCRVPRWVYRRRPRRGCSVRCGRGPSWHWRSPSRWCSSAWRWSVHPVCGVPSARSAGLWAPDRSRRRRGSQGGGGVRDRAPLWLSAAGLLAGLGAAVETARRLWRAAADSWAAGHGIAALRRALEGLDALLAEALREHWATEERMYCADAARSVAGMLRATADAADAEAMSEPDRPAAAGVSGTEPPVGDDWLSSASVLGTDVFAAADDADSNWASLYAWDDAPSGNEPAEPAEQKTSAPAADPWEDHTAGVPRWLDRESGEGGPELVATLAGDLTDAALVAMKSYWGAVERGQAGALAVRRTEKLVRDLLSTARRHLRRNGVLAPPPFVVEHRTRATSANLLGTDPHRVAELVGADADRRAVVQLSSPEQGTLLSRDPAAAVWIRFAPEAVRAEVEKTWRTSGSTQPHEALWTSSGRYAGLIRLTPLRMGVVDTVRPRQSLGADPVDAYERRDGDHW
ncbi:hypothetical protein O1L44_05400 [Streptomyces noursei]|nr:hypothetical protein [Streptomyces noursei]